MFRNRESGNQRICKGQKKVHKLKLDIHKNVVRKVAIKRFTKL